MTLKPIKAAAPKTVVAGTLAYIDLYEIVEVMKGVSSPLFRAKKIGARFGEVVARPLPMELVANAEQLEKVRQGFLRLVALRHANIVPLQGLHDIGEVRYTSDAARAALGELGPGGVLVLTEFAPGRTLDVWRREFAEGKVPADVACGAARQIAAALDFAHRHGVLHLDLKPQNVMVETRKGGKTVVRVMDFCPVPETTEGTADDDLRAMARLSLELLTGVSSPASIEQLPPGVATVFNQAIGTDVEKAFKTCTEFVKALEKACASAAKNPSRRVVQSVLGGLLVLVSGVAVYSHILANRRAEVLAAEVKAAEARVEAAKKAATKALAEEKARAEVEKARLEAEKADAEAKAAKEKALAEEKARAEAEKARQDQLKEQADRLQAEREAAEKAAREREAALAAARKRAAVRRREATERARRLFAEANWKDALVAAREGDLEDPELQYRVGTCYLEGQGLQTNVTAGAKLIKLAAEKKWPAALSRLGELHLIGLGCETNAVRAAALFSSAADLNDAEGHWRFSQCLERGIGTKPLPGEAVRHLEAAARLGHARAQYTLGLRTKDRAQAAEWFRKSAEQGYAPAQAKFGDCLIYGSGVAKDSSAAVRWYTRAADGGDASGQRALGLCYDAGTGVREDARRAVELYKSAAEGGDLLAKALYSQCLFLGLGITRDYATAWRMARESADGGCAFGQYMAGICCETGNGTIRSRLNAKIWYEKAIAQGLECARERLDRMQIK